MEVILQRLDELEMRSAYQERMVEDLNQVVIRQQQALERLERELSALRQQVGEAHIRRPQDDSPPPHY